MLRTMRLAAFCGMAAALPFTTLAQRPERPERDHFPPPAGGPMRPVVDFLGVEEGADAKVVKGAPYKAETVTEINQTLADGNRLSRKSTGAVYRDSEGRTRREQSLAAIGPLMPKDAPKLIFLHDPVTNTRYVLDPERRVARKLPPPRGERHTRSKRSAADQTKSESLGTRVIEGVAADGTRSTMTIPVGEMGNQRPIEVVSERWYSTDLSIVVSSTHKDPLVGETTYKLVGLVRGEPEHSLFEVPPDYQLTEGRDRERQPPNRKKPQD